MHSEAVKGRIVSLHFDFLPTDVTILNVMWQIYTNTKCSKMLSPFE